MVVADTGKVSPTTDPAQEAERTGSLSPTVVVAEGSSDPVSQASGSSSTTLGGASVTTHLALSTVPAGEVRSPVVTPLDWSGEPIEARVLMVVYEEARFSGFAVADLAERSLNTYARGRHYFDPITLMGQRSPDGAMP